MAFIVFLCPLVFGQSSYKGLTPGISKRPEVERVLGKPVRSVSKTLIEYGRSDFADKIFVQYADGSDSARAERIEMICGPCDPDKMGGQIDPAFSYAVTPDVRVRDHQKAKVYFGAPRFLRIADYWGEATPDVRIALMSREMYEGDLPTSGCTDSIIGAWIGQSSYAGKPALYLDLGRVKIEKNNDGGIAGRYETNNGSFILKLEKLEGSQSQNYRFGHTRYVGEWKDDAGSGLVRFDILGKQIWGSFRRTSTTTRSKAGAKAAYDRVGANFSEANWYGDCVPR